MTTFLMFMMVMTMIMTSFAISDEDGAVHLNTAPCAAAQVMLSSVTIMPKNDPTTVPREYQVIMKDLGSSPDEAFRNHACNRHKYFLNFTSFSCHGSAHASTTNLSVSEPNSGQLFFARKSEMKLVIEVSDSSYKSCSTSTKWFPRCKADSRAIISCLIETCGHGFDSRSIVWRAWAEIKDGTLVPGITKAEHGKSSGMATLKGIMKPFDSIALAFSYRNVQLDTAGGTAAVSFSTTAEVCQETEDTAARKDGFISEDVAWALVSSLHTFSLFQKVNSIQDLDVKKRSCFFANVFYVSDSSSPPSNETLSFNFTSFNRSMELFAFLLQRFAAHESYLSAVSITKEKASSIVSQKSSTTPKSPWAATLGAQPPPSTPTPPPPSTTPPPPLKSSPTSVTSSGESSSKHEAKYRVPWILFGLVLSMVLICLLYAKYGKFFWNLGQGIKAVAVKIGQCCSARLKDGGWTFWKKKLPHQSQEVASSILTQPQMTGLVTGPIPLAANASAGEPLSATITQAALMFTNTLFNGQAPAAKTSSAQGHGANKPSTTNDENHLTYLPYEEWPPTLSDIPTITNILYSVSSLGTLLPQGEEKFSHESGSTRKEAKARFYDDHRKGSVAPNPSPNEAAGSSSAGVLSRDAMRHTELLDGNVDVEISSDPKTTKELFEYIGKSIESTGKLLETAGRFLESAVVTAESQEKDKPLGQSLHWQQLGDVHDASQSTFEREKIERKSSSRQVTQEIAETVLHLIQPHAEESDQVEEGRSYHRSRRLNKDRHNPARKIGAHSRRATHGDDKLGSTAAEKANNANSSEADGSPRSDNPGIEHSKPSFGKGKRKHSGKEVLVHQGPRPSSSNSSIRSSSLGSDSNMSAAAKKRTVTASRSVDGEDFTPAARSKSVSPAWLQAEENEDGAEELDSKIVSTSAYTDDRVFSNMLYNSSESPFESRCGSPLRSKMSSSKLSLPGDANLVETRRSSSKTALTVAVAGGRVQSAGDEDNHHRDYPQSRHSEKLIDLAIGKGGFPQPGGSSPRENLERQTTAPATSIKVSSSQGPVLGPHMESDDLQENSTVPLDLKEFSAATRLDEERRKRLKRANSLADQEDHPEALLKRRKFFAPAREQERNSPSPDSDFKGKEILSSDERPVVVTRMSSRFKSLRRQGSAKFKGKSKEMQEEESTCTSQLSSMLYEPTVSDIGDIGDVAHVCPRFKFEELKRATNAFANRLKITKDSHGVFFKGVLDTNTPIAVKVIDHTTRQRPSLDELSDLNQLRHPHLAHLLGFCKHSLGKYYVVYEWISGGSVDGVLFERRHFKSESIVPWKKRFAIIKSVAEALSHLHSNEAKPVIVHRNVKANNVMFQSEKLSDFGFAWLMEHGCRQTSSLFSTTIGKHSMMAPEFMASKRATTKSDVYGFGILALEIVSGRRTIDRKAPADRVNLADWICRLDSEEKSLLDAMDKNLYNLPMNKLIETQAEMIFRLGFSCIQADPASRPSMTQIVQMLEGEAPIPDTIKQDEFAASIAAPITLFDVDHESPLPRDISQANASDSDVEESPPLPPGSNNLEIFAIQLANDAIIFDTNGKPNERKRSKSHSYINCNPLSLGLADSNPLAPVSTSISAIAPLNPAPASSSSELRSELKTPSKPLQLPVVDYIPYESQAQIINLFDQPTTAAIVECTDADLSVSSVPNVQPISNFSSNTDTQASSTGASTIPSWQEIVSHKGIIVSPTHDQKQPSEGGLWKDLDISLPLPKLLPPKSSPRRLGNFEFCDSCQCRNADDFPSSSDDGTAPPCQSFSTTKRNPMEISSSKCKCHLPYNTLGGDPGSQRHRRKKKAKNRIIISGPGHIQISKTDPLLGSVPIFLNDTIIASTSSSSLAPQLPPAQFQVSESLGKPTSTAIPSSPSRIRKSGSFIYITPLPLTPSNTLLAPESSVLVSVSHDPHRQIQFQTEYENLAVLRDSSSQKSIQSKNLSGKSTAREIDHEPKHQAGFLSSPPSPSFGDTL